MVQHPAIITIICWAAGALLSGYFIALCLRDVFDSKINRDYQHFALSAVAVFVSVCAYCWVCLILELVARRFGL